jgi:hypothetical protein
MHQSTPKCREFPQRDVEKNLTRFNATGLAESLFLFSVQPRLFRFVGRFLHINYRLECSVPKRLVSHSTPAAEPPGEKPKPEEVQAVLNRAVEEKPIEKPTEEELAGRRARDFSGRPRNGNGLTTQNRNEPR